MQEFIKKLIERLKIKEEELERISSECALSELKKERNYGYHIAISHTIEIVNQLAEEYKNNSSETLTGSEGWIPCSERLPDAEADVLLSLRSLDIYVGFMANTEGMFYVEGEGYVEYENVLAWQPLPAPYQQKGE